MQTLLATPDQPAQAVFLPDLPLLDWPDYMLPSAPKVVAGFNIVRKHVGAKIGGDTSPLKLYVDGPTGTGKTALARLVGRKLPSAIVVEIESGELLDACNFDFLKGRAFCWRVLIVNEAQNIRKASYKSIMGGLDAMGPRSACIFTTMERGSKIKPLFGDYQVDRAITDRCLELNLTNQGVKTPENIGKVLAMAQAHGLDYGATEQAVSNLFEAEQNSIRGVLAAISRGALAA